MSVYEQIKSGAPAVRTRPLRWRKLRAKQVTPSSWVKAATNGLANTLKDTEIRVMRRTQKSERTTAEADKTAKMAKTNKME